MSTDQTYFTDIILVCDPVLYPALAKTMLMGHPLTTPKSLTLAKPIVAIHPVHTQEDLIACCRGVDLSSARLLTCGTDVIVPAEVLGRLPHPGYNIHPGLPSYPGRYPSVFAIYDGAQEFGTTVHELAPQVDSGPIVAIDRFPMPEKPERAILETMSFQSVLNVVMALTPAFLSAEGLPHLDLPWQGVAKRQSDFDALCCLPSNVDEGEFHRRLRAVGEGPNHALEMTVFGHRFVLDNRRETDVLRAGQKIIDNSPE